MVRHKCQIPKCYRKGQTDRWTDGLMDSKLLISIKSNYCIEAEEIRQIDAQKVKLSTEGSTKYGHVRKSSTGIPVGNNL